MATYIIVIKSLLLGELGREQASSQGLAFREAGRGEGGWPEGPVSLSGFPRVTKPT